MSRAFSRGCILLLLLGLVVESVAAQGMPESQPPVWSATPDIAAFEKMENTRMASAQRAIDKLVAVRGSRTIGNTLVPYDQAFEQIDDAINGNVLVSADRLGLALGVEMIAVVVIVMAVYWMLQLRARRWQQ